MIVQSVREKKFLTTKSNLKKSQVLPLGYAHYDVLADKKNYSIARIKKKYSLPSKKKIVLWLTQSHDEDFIKNDENNINCKNIMPFFVDNDEYQLVIKLHPNEDQRAPVYVRWMKKFDITVNILGKEANTFELIAASDAVLTKHSSTAFEAVLLDKPLIRVELIPNKYLTMYDGTGLDVRVTNDSSLADALALVSALSYKKKLLFIKRKLIRERFPNFGNAGKIIIHTIKHLKI